MISTYISTYSDIPYSNVLTLYICKPTLNQGDMA